MVNKARINYWINAGLVVTFIISFITGLFKWPGLIRVFGLRHKLFPMYDVNWLHDWSGLLMGLLVLVHIILHWKWIVCMTRSLFKKRRKEAVVCDLNK